MPASVVSIIETRKARLVSITDLHNEKQGASLVSMSGNPKLGAVIRYLLKQAGENEVVLCALTGHAKSTISKKLNGIHGFKDEEKEKIAAHFGLEGWKLDALAGGATPEQLEFSDGYHVMNRGFVDEVLEAVRRKKKERDEGEVG